MEKEQRPSLYDTVLKEYSKPNKNPCTRIVFISKITQAPKDKKAKKVKDVATNPELIKEFTEQIEAKLEPLSKSTNLMMAFIGSQYAIYGLENSNSEIMKFAEDLYKNTPQIFEKTSIIYVNDECPVQLFPKFYVYEGEVFDKDNQNYKDMLASEKGWTLYDCFFCNLGKKIKDFIHSKDDFKNRHDEVRDAEKDILKFYPSINEVDVFMGEDYMTLEEFVKMYIDEIEIEMDDDVVYPYYWPIGTL